MTSHVTMSKLHSSRKDNSIQIEIPAPLHIISYEGCTSYLQIYTIMYIFYVKTTANLHF